MNGLYRGKIARRRFIQWCLLPIVPITIALGWKYPLLGFSVLLVMITAVVGGVLGGRYVCGTLCPRGSFFDRIVQKISFNSAIPTAFRNKKFRWLLFAAMMGFMIFRISQNPTSMVHWGRVFWLMCVITTAIGLTVGILIHPRAWCAFCPMGTMQNALGGRKYQLKIDAEACLECGLCEKACPFSLPIVKYKKDGFVQNPDCLNCPECAAACPVNALTLTASKSTSASSDAFQ